MKYKLNVKLKTKTFRALMIVLLAINLIKVTENNKFWWIVLIVYSINVLWEGISIKKTITEEVKKEE